MFSAANLGHNPPQVVSKVTEQMGKVCLVNLAGHHALWPPFAEMMCTKFGYDKIISMTSGTEAADTACKLARKWGIKSKGIPANECLVLGVGACYHGLGSSVWPLMDSSPTRKDYGLGNTMVTNVSPSGENLGYLDLDAMRRCLEQFHDRIAGVIIECFHGTSRTVEEERVYARGVYDLCKQYNVLFIADEVRQGAGKTGKFLSYEHLGEDCKPDVVTMGKSITAGVYPQSFILGHNKVMSLIGPFEMASTFGYTPLGIAAAQATIETIETENLLDRASELGRKWKAIVEGWNHPKVNYVFVMGADSNLFLHHTDGPRFAALCMHKGLFSHPRPDGLRLSFPLIMTDAELEAGAAIIREALDEVDQYQAIPGEFFPY